ncbi:MAG: hypothetical protein AAF989_16090 [Planctomycetota bacterium]
MLTATCDHPVSDQMETPAVVSHNETLLSDEEIMRRVSQIRSNWSDDERVERRVEAERRFENLLSMLTAA